MSSWENNILDANGRPEKTFYDQSDWDTLTQPQTTPAPFPLVPAPRPAPPPPECHRSLVFYTNPNGSIQIKKMHSKIVKLEVHIQGLG